MKIIVTGLSDTYAHILNVENMGFAAFPILDCWKDIFRRAFITHEVLTLSQHKF